MTVYPDDWHEIATRVKSAAAWRCVRCGHRHETPRRPLDCDGGCDPTYHGLQRKQRILTVHHLDGDKSNCRWWNLVPLCQVCHLSVQARVVMSRRWMYEHSEWFRPYVAGWYAWRYLGQDLSAHEVATRIDELLALERQA